MNTKNLNKITITRNETKKITIFGRILGCVTNEEANGIRQVSDYRKKAWTSQATLINDVKEAILKNKSKLRLVVAVKESEDITFDGALSLLITDVINGVLKMPNNCTKLLGRSESIYIN